MGDLGDGTGSSYPAALDTDTNQEVNSPSASKTKARAEVPNDLAAAVIAAQTELGTDPAGTVTDVKTYLQTEHETDGTHGEIAPTGLVLAGSAWPSFSVDKNGSDQLDIASGSDTKITWDGANADFDTNSDFDDANDRFTPTVAGKYLLTCFIAWITGTVGANDIVTIYIYKNGAATHKQEFKIYSSHAAQEITAVVDANGSGDYFEIFANNDARATSDIDGTATNTKFMGSRIA